MRKGKILPIVSRERIEDAVAIKDCSGKQISPDLREDIIRYCLFAAEIQRDLDYDQLEKS